MYREVLKLKCISQRYIRERSISLITFSGYTYLNVFLKNISESLAETFNVSSSSFEILTIQY